jgi:hypothetical protein
MAARSILLASVLAVATGAAAAGGRWVNVSSGGPLEPGVYGRIEVHGAPPPLISPRSVIGRKALGPVRGEPLYFYLPAGQVRKWSQYCQRYAACERPVFFVRMDNTPGELGRWNRREKALHHHGAAKLPAGAGGTS